MLEVKVFDHENREFPHATVDVLLLSKAKAQPIELHFSNSTLSYHNPKLKPGSYQLRVSIPEKETITRHVEFNGSYLRQEIFLQPDPNPSTLHQPEEELAIQMTSDYKDDEDLEELWKAITDCGAGLASMENRSMEEQKFRLLIFPEKLSEAKRTEVRQQLLKHKKVAVCGSRTKIVKDNFLIPDGTYYVRFTKGILKEELDRFLKENELQLGEPYYNAPLCYHVLSDDSSEEKMEHQFRALKDSPLVEEVEQQGVGPKIKLSPHDFLYPHQWHLPVINAEGAWNHLRTLTEGLPSEKERDNDGPEVPADPNDPLEPNNLTYGSASIIIGLLDPDGVPTQPIGNGDAEDVQPLHPDLIGNLVTGQKKSYRFIDFNRTDPDSGDFILDNNRTDGPHAMGCIGAFSPFASYNVDDDHPNREGIVGIAANTRFISVQLGGNVAVDNLAYAWAGGLPVNDARLTQLNPGAEILTNSWALPRRGPSFHAVMDQLVYYGRKGRGVLNFHGSGNEAEDVNVKFGQAAYEKSIAIGASSIATINGRIKETIAVYSNHGREIDFCAPSSLNSRETTSDPYHNPPRDYGAISLERLDDGNMPEGAPPEHTHLTLPLDPLNPIDGNPRLIQYQNTPNSPITEDCAVMIGEPGDTFSIRMDNGRQVIDAVAGSPVLDRGLPIPNNSEAKKVTIGPNPATGQNSRVSTLFRINYAHSDGRIFYGGAKHYTNRFGGTSFATPLAAGISALVLTAKPTMTWQEVKFMMRDTAVKIDYALTQTPDAAPNGRFRIGVWRDEQDREVVDLGGNIHSAVPTLITRPTQAINIGDTRVPVESSNRFLEGQLVAIYEDGDLNGQSVQIILSIDAPNNVLILDHIRTSYPNPGRTNIRAGRIPHFSQVFGHGRLDAAKAVEAAINFSHDHLDLMIRDREGDFGIETIEPEDHPIHSPDIWINSFYDKQGDLDYNVPGPHLNETLLAQPDFGSPTYFAAGGGVPPTQRGLTLSGVYLGTKRGTVRITITANSVPIPGGPGSSDTFIWSVNGGAPIGPRHVANTGNGVELEAGLWMKFGSIRGYQIGSYWEFTVQPHQQYVYARIKNRGDGGPHRKLRSLTTWVRSYLRFSDAPNHSFQFPEDYQGLSVFDPAQPVNPRIDRSYLIDEVIVPEGKIGPLENWAAKIPWTTNWLIPAIRNDFNGDEAKTDKKTYLLTHVSPLDGERIGPGTEDNNNLSYREILFANIHFWNRGDENAPPHAFAPPPEAETIESEFRIVLKAEIGSFLTENVQIRVLRRTIDEGEELTVFSHSNAVQPWSFHDDQPDWASFDSPINLRTGDPVQGRQIQVSFEGSVIVNRTTDYIEVQAEVLSEDHQGVIAANKLQFEVFQPGERPEGTAGHKTILPRSHVFADLSEATQSVEQTFGPVPDSADSRYRVTSSFNAPNQDLVPAYATVDGFFMIQPVEGDDDKVNLILEPYRQPINGFTPVRYFIYRGLRKSDFIGANPLHVREGGEEATQLINHLYNTIHDRFNEGERFLSTYLGFDPTNQPDGDPIDPIFNRTDPEKHMPPVKRGMHIGNFAGRDNTFGFEIVLRENTFPLDFAFARKSHFEIDVSRMPESNDVERLAKRLRREDILNFMDPAAYYGLHNHRSGWVEVKEEDNGEEVTNRLEGEEIYSKIISRFFTRNRVYIDIRNELGFSLNYYQNYHDEDDGSVLMVGSNEGNLSPVPYAATSWPILFWEDDSPADAEVNVLRLKMRTADNPEPILFIAHGTILEPSSKGGFIDQFVDEEDDDFTKTLTLGLPAVFNGDEANPARVNQSWLVKFFVSRQVDENPCWISLLFNDNHFTDSVFGPIDVPSDREDHSSTRWQLLPGRNYIQPNGLKFMADKGIAYDNRGAGRVILFAMATDFLERDGNRFSTTTGITGGISKEDSFLKTALFFGELTLERQNLQDDGPFKGLRFIRNGLGPDPRSILMLGLTAEEFANLRNINGLEEDAGRFIRLEGEDENEEGGFTKYELCIMGLEDDGDGERESPRNGDINVYTLDGNFYFSADFSALEP